MTDGPFHKLHHVCIVVRDLDRVTRFYESVGIGPWHDYSAMGSYQQLEAGDADAFRALRFRYAWVGPVQLQLVEPGPGDTPQKRLLDSRGEGVFHLGFAVDDIDLGEAEGSERGAVVTTRGRTLDGGGFTFFDTASHAGGVSLAIRGPGS